jgi:hypothetical protein
LVDELATAACIRPGINRVWWQGWPPLRFVDNSFSTRVSAPPADPDIYTHVRAGSHGGNQWKSLADHCFDTRLATSTTSFPQYLLFRSDATHISTRHQQRRAIPRTPWNPRISTISPPAHSPTSRHRDAVPALAHGQGRDVNRISNVVDSPCLRADAILRPPPLFFLPVLCNRAALRGMERGLWAGPSGNGV